MKMFLNYRLDGRAAETMPEEIQKEEIRHEIMHEISKGLMGFFSDEDLNITEKPEMNPYYIPSMKTPIEWKHKEAHLTFYVFREKELEDLKEVVRVLSMVIPSSPTNTQRHCFNAVLEVLNRKFENG